MSRIVELGLVFVGDVVVLSGVEVRIASVSSVQGEVDCRVTVVGEDGVFSFTGYSDQEVRLVEQGQYSLAAGVVGEFDWLGSTAEEIDAELDREEAEELANGWDGEPVLSEYEQGWANIRADERAAVARQNAEDLAYANRPQSSYMGVRGVWNPEDGWIYEP